MLSPGSALLKLGRAAGSAVGGLDTTRAGLWDTAKALHKRWVSHGGKLKVLFCLCLFLNVISINNGG